tara:strand:- start:24724 stop:25308 length:585 start_codon:yes stop_codon:yes gene_type:complete
LKAFEDDKIELLQSLKNGDRTAFNIIFNKYQKKLYYFIFSITKSKYNTEEILQSVFIKIWTNKESINLSKSFDSYVFTIAKNLTYNHLRTISNRESLRLELWQTISFSTKQTDDELLFSEYESIVNDILEGIPKQKRSIYVLSREEGKSNQEIAELLGITQKTVKNHLWKTLQTIKEQLKPYIKVVVFFFLSNS